MNLLNKLTKKNLLLNKKRTIVTIIGIILSVALISALSSLVVSFQASMINFEKINTGNFHESFSGLELEDIKKFKENRKLEAVFFTKDIGYAKIEEIKNEYKPFAYVTAYDFSSLENLGLNLVEGRLPKTSKEIVIPRHLKTNGRVDLKVGETIKLNIGKRLSLDNHKLNQFNPFNNEEEKFEAEGEIEYKIVGIIERPSSKIEDYEAPGYTFITCLDTNEEGSYNAYVRFNKKELKDFLRTTANILGVDENLYVEINSSFSEDDYDEYMNKLEKLNNQLASAKYSLISSNKTLISLEGGASSDPSLRVLINVAAIVTAIIIATSVFCIKNSFNISITEKTKQYGMLASMGATKKQIKKNVLYEAFVLGLIGIPLGLIGGLLAAYILIMICNYMLADSLNINLVFAISYISLGISVLLGALTIYLSAVRSARKASRISPITAIRNNDDIKIKSKKIKSPRIIKKLFGIGGDVSYKNLKRNNKKYRTTVISIIVCVSVFIALYSFMNLAFKTVEIQYGERNYNLEIYVNTDNKETSDNIKKQLLSIEGYKKYDILRSFYVTIQNPSYTKEYRDFYERVYDSPDLSEISKTASLKVYSVGEEEYRSYIKKIGLNYDEVVNKAILINNDVEWIPANENNSLKKTEITFFNYKIGEFLKGEYRNTSETSTKGNYEIEIGGVTSARPLGLENSFGEPILIISDAKLEEVFDSNHFILNADMENPDTAQDEAEKILSTLGDSKYDIYNLDRDVRAMNSMFTLIAIFLYGFITVIALIGITNIFNTITTNMELRSREFAMLKSIGMTKKEFNRMIRMESLFYGTKSLIIGIPIGCGLSYLIYKMLMKGYWSFGYTLPYVAIIISVLAVYLLVTCIMKYSINKINKQNTIETIRNDNI